MRTTFSTETGVKTWHMDKWYQKTMYIIGVGTTALMALGFIVGFVQGIIGA